MESAIDKFNRRMAETQRLQAAAAEQSFTGPSSVAPPGTGVPFRTDFSSPQSPAAASPRVSEEQYWEGRDPFSSSPLPATDPNLVQPFEETSPMPQPPAGMIPSSRVVAEPPPGIGPAPAEYRPETPPSQTTGEMWGQYQPGKAFSEEPPTPPWTGEATEEERMYGAALRYGYTEAQVQGIAAETGAATPQEMYSAVMANFGQTYGALPPPSVKTGTTKFSPTWWAQMGAGAKSLEGPGKTAIPEGEQPPPSWAWPEHEVRWQGLQATIEAKKMMDVGLIHLPGTEPGTILSTVAPAKVGKRAKLTERITEVTSYGPSGEEIGQEAFYKTSPRSVAKSQHGLDLKVAMPLFDVLPSGEALLKQGVISRIGRQAARTLSVPIGATDMPEVGTTWNLAEREKVIPYKGAAPLNLGSWERAELTGSSPIRVRNKQGEYEIRQQLLFGLSSRPGGVPLKAKVAGSKAFVTEARAGGVEEFTGRKDVQLVLPGKDLLGEAWMSAQRTSPEALAKLLGVPVEEIQGKTWQELGTAYTEKFRQEILQYKSEEHPQGMLEDIAFTMNVHKSQLEAGYFAKGEDLESWIAKKDVVEGQPDIFRVTTKPVPTLVANLYTVLGRDYPYRRPFLNYRELERLKLSNPEEYEKVMQESQGPREAYGGLLGAAYATRTGQQMRRATPLTQEAALEMTAAATAQVQAEIGIEDVSTIPRQRMTTALMSQAQERYGAAPLELPGGQGTLVGAEQLQYFSSVGSQEEETVGKLPSAWAGAIQAVAEGGDEAEIQRALRVQEEAASGQKIAKRAAGAFLPKGRAGGGVYAASMALAPAEALMPAEQVMQGYGIKPGTERAEEFMAAWEGGQITPSTMMVRRPAQGNEPFSFALPLIPPSVAKERGVLPSEENPIVLSAKYVSAAAGDVDSDQSFFALTGTVRGRGEEMSIEGGLPLYTNQQVTDLAQRAERRGASSLASEFLSGKSPEELRAALDPANMYEYNEERFTEAMRGDVALREKIGPTFNILESGILAGRMAGDEQATAAAETLFGTIHGIRQRPGALSPAAEGLMQQMQSAKLFTGGVASMDAMRYVGKNFETYAARLALQTMNLTRPGSLTKDLSVFSAGEAASLLTRKGEGREEMTANIAAWQKAMAAGRGGEAATLGGLVTSQVLGGGAAGFAETTIGAMAFPQAYRRLKSAAAGSDENAAKARDVLNNMSPDLRKVVEETSARQANYRTMLKGGEGGPVEAIQTHDPRLAEELGIGPKEFINQEIPQDVEELFSAVEAALPSTGAAPPAEAAPPSTGAPAQAAPQGTGAPPSEEEAMWQSTLAGESAWAGGGGGGMPPPAPPRPPSGPSVAGPTATSGMTGTGGGVVPPTAPPGTGIAQPPQDAGPPQRQSGFPPVSKTDFEASTQKFTETIDLWNATVKPKIDAGQPLTSAEKKFTRSLESWRKTMWRGVMQAGEDAGWAEKERGPIGTALSHLKMSTAATDVAAANTQMDINEIQQNVGAPTSFSSRGLAYLSNVGVPKERAQALEAYGPELIQSVEAEAAWASAGGRENVENLYQSLRGAGISTEGGQERYGAALSGQLRTFASNIAGLQKQGVETPERYTQLLEQAGMAGHTVAKRQAAVGAERGVQEVDTSLKTFTERLDLASKGLGKVTERSEELADIQGKLSTNQQKEFQQAQFQAKTTLGALRGIEATGAQLTPEQFALKQQAEAIQQAGWKKDFGEEMAGLAPEGIGERVLGGAAGILKGVTSGWGMMQMRRWWGMTGGYAMGKIPLAAQEEQAAVQAAMVGVPTNQYQPGGQALDLMTYQAQKQNWQADIGKAAYGAWGWTQQGGLGGGLAAGIGIGGPAVGAGLIGAQLASWAGLSAAGPIGLGIAGVAAAYGTGQYINSVGQDRARTALMMKEGQPELFKRGIGVSSYDRGTIAAALAGQLPGMREDRSYNPLTEPISGSFNLMTYAAGEMLQDQGARIGEWKGKQTAFGQRLATGNLEGLNQADRTAVIQEAAEEATGPEGPLSWMQTQAATQLGGEWRKYWGGTNIKDVYEDPRFAQMAQRGLSPEKIAQIGQQWGVAPGASQQLLNQFVGESSETQQIQNEYTLGQYRGFMNFGVEGMDIRNRGYAGGLNELSSQGRFDLNRMQSGSRYWWSQAGQDLGEDRWQTVNPETGMGIGTNWGGNVLGQRIGQTGEAGQNITLDGGNVQFTIGGGAKVDIGFNQWDIQDFATKQGRGYQDWQYQFQQAGLGLSASYTTGEGGQFAGRGVWQMQDESRDLSRAYQGQQFGFQREGMDTSDQQYKERWNLQWSHVGTQNQQWLEDASRNWQRQQTQFGWQREDLAYQGAKSTLQFGWQMEDFEEQERFATGRDRRRIETQRGRAAIQFGMGQGQLDTQEGRLDQREEWAKQDFELAKGRHSQALGWQREEMQLQLRHHNQNLDLSKRRLKASVDYFHGTNALQDKQTDAAREYWKMQHDRQLEALEKGHEYQKLMRDVQDAQTALSRAQQLQTAEFAKMWEDGGLVRKAWDDFFDYLETKLDTTQSGGGSGAAKSGSGSASTYITPSDAWRSGHRAVGGV